MNGEPPWVHDLRKNIDDSEVFTLARFGSFEYDKEDNIIKWGSFLNDLTTDGKTCSSGKDTMHALGGFGLRRSVSCSDAADMPPPTGLPTGLGIGLGLPAKAARGQSLPSHHTEPPSGHTDKHGALETALREEMYGIVDGYLDDSMFADIEKDFLDKGPAIDDLNWLGVRPDAMLLEEMQDKRTKKLEELSRQRQAEEAETRRREEARRVEEEVRRRDEEIKRREEEVKRREQERQEHERLAREERVRVFREKEAQRERDRREQERREAEAKQREMRDQQRLLEARRANKKRDQDRRETEGQGQSRHNGSSLPWREHGKDRNSDRSREPNPNPDPTSNPSGDRRDGAGGSVRRGDSRDRWGGSMEEERQNVSHGASHRSSYQGHGPPHHKKEKKDHKKLTDNRDRRPVYHEDSYEKRGNDGSPRGWENDSHGKYQRDKRDVGTDRRREKHGGHHAGRDGKKAHKPEKHRSHERKDESRWEDNRWGH